MTLTLGFVYEDGTFEIKEFPYLSEIKFLKPEDGYTPIQIFASHSEEAKNYYNLDDFSHSLLDDDDFFCEEVFILEHDKINPVLIAEGDELKLNLSLSSLRYFMFNKLI